MTIHSFRVLLIRLGKISPFLITFLVFISYVECLLALMTNSLAEYNGEVVLYKPLSWAIASYFEYDMYVVAFLTILAIAIETCIWNKLALLYLFIQLIEKGLLNHVMLDLWVYYIIVITNALISLVLTLKGIRNVNSRNF